tara:strand:- start:536 stop:679 length:144 start_codon:yes stop_codon:yes gene_type:complete
VGIALGDGEPGGALLQESGCCDTAGNLDAICDVLKDSAHDVLKLKYT